MSRKFEVWLDSGANSQSRRAVTVTLDEIGIDDDEWDEMPEEDKEEAMKDVAFDRADWGYIEVDA